MHEKEGLIYPIGVGPNKLVPRIGSDFEEPNGLTVIRNKDAKEFLSPRARKGP